MAHKTNKEVIFVKTKFLSDLTRSIKTATCYVNFGRDNTSVMVS